MTAFGAGVRLGPRTYFQAQPQPWSPMDLGDLVGWFDVSDTSAYTASGGRITTILNKAGRNWWTANSNAALRPVLDQVGLNGLPAMRFNGINAIALSDPDPPMVAAMADSQAITVIAVVQADVPTGSWAFLAAGNSGFAGSRLRYWGVNNAPNSYISTAINNASTQTSAQSTANQVNPTPHVFSSWTDGSVASISIDGAAPNPGGASQAIGTLTPNQVSIGASVTTGTSQLWKGVVSEILVFRRQLSDDERARVVVWLARKWGVPVNPLTILGSLAWRERADQGITQATGVSQWDDISGNGRHFTQATGSAQPTFVASSPAANGRPVVRSDGSADWMSNTFARVAPGTTPFYLWAVANPISWAGTRFLFGDFTGSTGGGICQSFSGVSAQWGTYNAAYARAAGSSPVGVCTRVEAYYSNSASDYVKGGSQQDNASGSGQNNAGGGGYGLFSRGDAFGFIQAELAEAFCFIGTPTSWQRAMLDAYAADLYGPGVLL